jgi:hypothetical protein
MKKQGPVRCLRVQGCACTEVDPSPTSSLGRSRGTRVVNASADAISPTVVSHGTGSPDRDKSMASWLCNQLDSPGSRDTL